MRRIDEIIIHCTATKAGSGHTMEDVRKWHRKRGWSDIGYHWVIEEDGAIRAGRPVNKIGAHAKGRNRFSVGIAYVGGLAPFGEGLDGPNTDQAASLQVLVKFLQHAFDLPDSKVIGHRDTGANKDCPSFDVEQWMRTGRVKVSRNLA